MLTAGPRRGLSAARSKGLQLRQSSGGTVRGSGAKRRGMRRRPRPSVVLSTGEWFQRTRGLCPDLPCARAWACLGEISHVAEIVCQCARAPCLGDACACVEGRAERGVSSVYAAHTLFQF